MADDLSKRSYLRWDDPAIANHPTEEEDIEALQKMFGMLIPAGFTQHGHTYPVTHAKTLGIVKGKLVVSADLPPHLKQGLFAQPGEYPVVMRYSSQNHDVGTDDRQHFFRAASLKIFNIQGERLPEGEGWYTQDFPFNGSSAESDLSDARTAKEVIGIRIQGLTDPKKALEELMTRPDAELQLRLTKAPLAAPEALEYYSQTPYRFGAHVGKHALFPATDQMKRLASVLVDPKVDSSQVMVQWLQKFFAENEAVYEWGWQLCENLKEQPVEFSGTAWDRQKYPYQTVAKLVFPKQDPYEYEVKTFWEDNMRVYPWCGLSTHEPLGSTNRARRAIYPAARAMREKLNARKVVNVRKLEDLPGPIPEGIPREGLIDSFIRGVETITE